MVFQRRYEIFMKSLLNRYNHTRQRKGLLNNLRLSWETRKMAKHFVLREIKTGYVRKLSLHINCLPVNAHNQCHRKCDQSIKPSECVNCKTDVKLLKIMITVNHFISPSDDYINEKCKIPMLRKAQAIIRNFIINSHTKHTQSWHASWSRALNCLYAATINTLPSYVLCLGTYVVHILTWICCVT